MNGNPDRGHPSVTGTALGLQVGFAPLLRAVEDAKKRQARHEEAIRKAAAKASEHCDPGRSVDVHLLGHEIPDHVADVIASETCLEPGEEQDRTKIWARIRFEIAPSLILRGYTCEEFCELLPAYTPPPGPEGPRSNVLFAELTKRGRREHGRAGWDQTLIAAWKEAEEGIGQGQIPDVDQKTEYCAALADRWRGWIASGKVRLFGTEAKVMDYVITQTITRGFVNVTCPSREVARAMGIKDNKTALAVLQRLADDGLLIKRSPGNGPARLAAIYCLPIAIPPGREQPEAPADNNKQRPEWPKANSSWGSAASLSEPNMQVKPESPASEGTPHTLIPRGRERGRTALGHEEQEGMRGSEGMRGNPSATDLVACGIEGVHSVAIEVLSDFWQVLTIHPVEVVGAVDAIEAHYAQQLSAWAVLWPRGRWPRIPILPGPGDALVMFEDPHAAVNWICRAGEGSRVPRRVEGGLWRWWEGQLRLRRHWGPA